MKSVAAPVIAVLAGIQAGAAGAQAFPPRPVRLIVPFAAGGPNDVVARIVGQKLTEAWGQPVVVDNRAGAGGNIGTSVVAKAVPDGHTLALVGMHFVVNPFMYASASYDAIKDFAPVSNVAVSPVIVVVHPSLPARDLAELVKLAAREQIVYASPGAGTAGHLGGELFSAVARVKMQHVPYKGAAPAITDLLGGQVKVGFTALPPAAPHVRTGKLRALAVTTASRSGALPEVPTVAEAGLTGFQVDTMYGVLAPAGAPRAVIDAIHRGIVKTLAAEDVRQKLISGGFDPVGNSPDEFAAYLKAELDKWGKVVRDAGLRAQ